MRLTLILLCFILAAAAAGRYKAEAAVRETRAELKRLDRAKQSELSSIQALRVEVAYLENPERLSEIARNLTDHEPLSGAQLMTADDFEIAFGQGARDEDEEKRAGEPTTPVDVAELGAADPGALGAR